MRVDNVADPYRVKDPAEVARELAAGRWVVFRHEYQTDECDLGAWLGAVRDACAQLDVVEQSVTISRKDLTVVFNAENVPTLDQVQASVSRVEVDRWMDRELLPELPARVARGE